LRTIAILRNLSLSKKKISLGNGKLTLRKVKGWDPQVMFYKFWFTHVDELVSQGLVFRIVENLTKINKF
jgi:hypothetical protein